MMQTRKFRNAVRRGFTLVEILVATAIMVIMVGIVIQITAEVLNVWNRSSGKLSANAQARIALELMTQDMETAVLRNNGQQWLRVEGPVTVTGPDNYASQTVAVKLFSPALDREEGPGDICAIAYRLEFKESYDGGPNVYALYRAIETPEETFDDLMGSPSDDPSPQERLDGTKLDGNDFWEANSILDTENFLAANIVDFRVIVYTEDPSDPSKVIPVNVNESTLPVAGNYFFGGDDATSSRPPVYVDIILTVLSDEGVQQLENVGRSGVAGTAEDVIREHGEIFTRRVNFLARPL